MRIEDEEERQQSTSSAVVIEDHPVQSKEATNEEPPYTIFPLSTIILLLTIAALTSMISPLTASIYLPAFNQIEQTLNITSQEFNLTVTGYVIFQAISPMFWGTIADYWGRRPVLLCTLLIYCGTCVGLYFTPNYAILLVLRMVQAFGSSSVVAICAGIVGDIAESKKRGSYFGVYAIGQLLGPPLGPVAGGIVTEKLGWRWIFIILLGVGMISCIAVGLFVPETLRSLVGNGSGYANPTPFQLLSSKRRSRSRQDKPFQRKDFLLPIQYLLDLDVLLVLLYCGLHFMSYYCILVTLSKQFSLQFQLTAIQIGLCFLSLGGGTIVGSFIHGKILDADYKIVMTKKQTDEPNLDNPSILYYRARLRNIWYVVITEQVVTLVYGWSFYFHAPLALPLVLQFIMGYCASAVILCAQSLLIDLFPGKGASITASNNLVRCLLSAIAIVCMEPGIKGIGICWLFTIIGLVLVLSNICVPILIKYGPEWNEKRRTRDRAEEVVVVT